MKPPKRIVLVDDSASYCELWNRFLLERYGPERVDVECHLHPLIALPRIGPDVDLLIVDLEMPMIDGRKFLEYAVERGVPRGQVIVASSRPAEVLHQVFPTGRCLAVINKVDPAQLQALVMILDGVIGIGA